MDEWHPGNSIIDHDLVLLAKKGLVTKVTITEHEEGGYFVTMRIKPDDDMIFLATRRVRNSPRIFMSLERLVTHLRVKMPMVTEMKLILLRQGLEQK